MLECGRQIGKRRQGKCPKNYGMKYNVTQNRKGSLLNKGAIAKKA